MDQSKVNIKRLIIFDNLRIHSIFDDETSLIIHSNPKCLTYFNRNSEQIRFLTTKLPEHENLIGKFQATVKFAGFVFCKNSCANELSFESFIKHQENDIILKRNKILNCRWGIVYLERFIKIEPDGSIIFNSIDNMCHLKLHTCGEVFEVQTLKLLKGKKAQYIETDISDDKKNGIFKD